MSHHTLALLGFGNVGKALARLLLLKRADLLSDYGITFAVTGIATARHGSAIDPAGIDLDRALALADEPGASLVTLSTVPPPADMSDFIQRCGADVLFENSPVDYATGQPAVDHLRLALENCMHAITANKGPVVHAYRELTALAQTKDRKFYFESTVMDGAPIFSLFREALPAARLKAFRGVLNSTTNMMLTRMELGDSFDQAVAYTQKIGIAETDPSGDIDGWDAAVKVAALVTVLMGVPLVPQEVDRQGIRAIGPVEVKNALEQGKRWKLVCAARREGDWVLGKVAPELVGPESPLFGAEGTTSVMRFETDILGELSIVEENPGPHTTAYGLLADFINAVRR
jgi:homoserine dehydrogenase